MSHVGGDFTKDLVITGIQNAVGKCYTHPLIFNPYLPTDSPVANIRTSIHLAAEDNPSFKTDVQTLLKIKVHTFQYFQYDKVYKELDHLRSLGDDAADRLSIFEKLPIHTYIQQLTSTQLYKMKSDAEWQLWHQRLGHQLDDAMQSASKHIDGVPDLPTRDRILEQCSTCLQAKQTKIPAKGTTLKATKRFQGFSIDFSFSGVKSKTTGRRKDYLGIHGETCWCLITDHFSKYIWGRTFKSKAVPLQYLRDFLATHCATRDPSRYVYLDQGGELYGCHQVQKLFERYGFQIRPTGSDSSHQLGPVERTHRTVANSIRAQLIGAALDVRFWPYCFDHTLRLLNANSCAGMDRSRIQAAFGRKDNFQGMRYFGCRVWCRPPGDRDIKFKSNSRKGIFLGFLPDTTKNIYYYDEESNRIKKASHFHFDEGFNDLPIEK